MKKLKASDCEESLKRTYEKAVEMPDIDMFTPAYLAGFHDGEAKKGEAVRKANQRGWDEGRQNLLFEMMAECIDAGNEEGKKIVERFNNKK